MKIPIVVSDAVAPNEIVLEGKRNAVRWTPDSGIEELSDYQREQIQKALKDALKDSSDSFIDLAGWGDE